MDKPNKKSIASIIVAKMKPKEDPMTDMGESEAPEYDAKESAAEDIMSAMEKKDPKMFLEAFKNLMDMCKDAPKESDED